MIHPAKTSPPEPKPESKVHAWTDGACLGNPGPGGWGVLLRTGKVEKELSGHEAHTTNNRMELLGAISALEALKRPVALVLCTDSKYVIEGATKWIHGWRARGWRTKDKKPVANQELWERLDKAAARHQVEWVWVKGHSGHAENERVDALAAAEAARARDGDSPAAVAPADAAPAPSVERAGPVVADAVRLSLDARVSIACTFEGKRAPAFCVRGPGNVGVACLTGDGAACAHARFAVASSTLDLEDDAGGHAVVATEGTARGPEAKRLRALLRAFGAPKD